MSLQWVAVAGFLYVEIGFTLLLILPLLKPSIWKWIFNMRIFSSMNRVWSTAFYATLLILVVLFVDSLRTMIKYRDELENTHLTLDAKLDRHLRECRGQRNFYITGFALFLILVIRRLITMLSQRATLEASHDAALSQAQSANRELQRRMDEEEQGDGGGEDKDKSKKQKKSPTQEQFDSVQKELKIAKVDLEAMKKQAESTNTEYDRLAAENQKLQNQLQEASGDTEGKKDQ